MANRTGMAGWYSSPKRRNPEADVEALFEAAEELSLADIEALFAGAEEIDLAELVTEEAIVGEHSGRGDYDVGEFIAQSSRKNQWWNKFGLAAAQKIIERAGLSPEGRKVLEEMEAAEGQQAKKFIKKSILLEKPDAVALKESGVYTSGALNSLLYVYGAIRASAQDTPEDRREYAELLAELWKHLEEAPLGVPVLSSRKSTHKMVASPVDPLVTYSTGILEGLQQYWISLLARIALTPFPAYNRKSRHYLNKGVIVDEVLTFPKMTPFGLFLRSYGGEGIPVPEPTEPMDDESFKKKFIEMMTTGIQRAAATRPSSTGTLFATSYGGTEKFINAWVDFKGSEHKNEVRIYDLMWMMDHAPDAGVYVPGGVKWKLTGEHIKETFSSLIFARATEMLASDSPPPPFPFWAVAQMGVWTNNAGPYYLTESIRGPHDFYYRLSALAYKKSYVFDYLDRFGGKRLKAALLPIITGRDPENKYDFRHADTAIKKLKAAFKTSYATLVTEAERMDGFQRVAISDEKLEDVEYWKRDEGQYRVAYEDEKDLLMYTDDGIASVAESLMTDDPKPYRFAAPIAHQPWEWVVVDAEGKTKKGEGKYEWLEPDSDPPGRIGPPLKEGGRLELVSEIGLRGVNYGKNTEESARLEHSRKLFASFHDLAEILNVPVTQMSYRETGAKTHGGLAIGVGFAGRGKHAGHYQPSRSPQFDTERTVYINMTKNRGRFGIFGHEWMHFFDNRLAMLAKIEGGLSGYPYKAQEYHYSDYDYHSLPNLPALESDGTMKTITDGSHEARSRAEKVTHTFRELMREIVGHHEYGGGQARRGRERRWYGSGRTSYNEHARILGVEYWGNRTELLSRAFEAYLTDWLAKYSYGVKETEKSEEWLSFWEDEEGAQKEADDFAFHYEKLPRFKVWQARYTNQGAPRASNAFGGTANNTFYTFADKKQAEKFMEEIGSGWELHEAEFGGRANTYMTNREWTFKRWGIEKETGLGVYAHPQGDERVEINEAFGKFLAAWSNYIAPEGKELVKNPFVRY